MVSAGELETGTGCSRVCAELVEEEERFRVRYGDRIWLRGLSLMQNCRFE
ncbi:hypothetical protein SERLA73DRAFT_131717 [Serpula lacrymans var. lacrymans S7.3]|uniref:Uncharacterized protein n=2 Tax=Serpula lacrymans var. lacrymans TaxID=341189 RepID=F8PPT8_SERL3|nr:uncharacterized protein SERLADRAFT_381332 [Serpula lacrymans var. lacrymans S7.9]EGO01455.1 hypothetical protein SERLA73DRAFT_131717 [Serpula lacrymans var. lacrymans S7.3]EGO27118.1 hypothetical protein SERLADRAFT_381332 [Serpula lacrymans var. lacrymans S7.9]